jgi:hypothetical protein
VAKLTKTVTRPEVTVEIVDGMKCDVCGRATDNDEFWPNEEHPDTTFGGTEVTVSIADKSRYPEGGSEDKEQWDLCPSCFDEHVRKPLLALGVAPTKKASSW